MAEVSRNVQQASPELIAELAQVDSDSRVISMYLDLDPSQEFAQASGRDSLVGSVVNEAAAQIERVAPSDERVSLREDLERVEDLLADLDDWGRDAASVAVFASSSRGLLRATKLSRPVATSVTVQEGAHLTPMIDVVRSGRWCVLLLDRSAARLFVGIPSRLEEIRDVDDDVRGQHDAGGFSQARFQRRVEEEVDDHVEKMAGMLFDLLKLRGFDRLVVGASEEMTHRLTDHLHPYVADRLTARIDVDIQNVSTSDLEERVTDVAELKDQERETQVLQRLRRELGTGGRAAAGLKPSLDALNDASVELLLVQYGFDYPGVRCIACGHLADSGERCPADGEEMVTVSSIVDKAVERTYALSGDVLVMHRKELEDLGGIAALLRFNPDRAS